MRKWIAYTFMQADEVINLDNTLVIIPLSCQEAMDEMNEILRSFFMVVYLMVSIL